MVSSPWVRPRRVPSARRRAYSSPFPPTLTQGLNASAVGLVALAAYQLSQKVVTDKISRLLLFFSAAIACCYESQWLYPVLMVAGGSTTLAYDTTMLYRARRVARAPVVLRAAEPTPALPNEEEIELQQLQLARPEPVAMKDGVGSTGVGGGEGSTTGLLRRTTTRGSVKSERYPTPPLEEERESTLENVVQEEQEETYFTLSVKGGLAMYVAIQEDLSAPS